MSTIASGNCASAAAQQPGVTIFNAGAIEAQASALKRQPHLLNCILSLAKQLTPGWRLSMRHRRLEAPDGTGIDLTTLEFNFIKIFTMVETGEAVSRKHIVRAFGEDYLSYDQNRLDTMVRRLRKKIKTRVGVQLPLNTERVRGFSFGDVLIIDP
ncbi:MAG: winged helix-turn-helix domain-containing protein [Pseudomonadota bacterium]